MRLAFANELIEHAFGLARERGHALTAAAVDAGGNLVAFARMDGAGLASIETALGKAYTALATGVSTKELSEAVQPGQPLFGFGSAVSTPRPLLPMAGGVPVRRGDELIGGFAIAGGWPPESDHDVAEQAVAAAVSGDAS